MPTCGASCATVASSTRRLPRSTRPSSARTAMRIRDVSATTSSARSHRLRVADMSSCSRRARRTAISRCSTVPPCMRSCGSAAGRRVDCSVSSPPASGFRSARMRRASRRCSSHTGSRTSSPTSRCSAASGSWRKVTASSASAAAPASALRSSPRTKPTRSVRIWCASPVSWRSRGTTACRVRCGLRYWRVTDVRSGLGEKADYSPGAAADRARSHATHFVGLLRDTLAAHRTERGGSALLTVTFDSELFGHWWFEGIDWLGHVLRDLAADGPTPVTAAEYLRREPPTERVDLVEGSWGKNNDHSTWLNDRTAFMWSEIAAMAGEIHSLRAATPSSPLRMRAARQAARELLLAQSSDWPFLVTTGQAADYAIERFRSHAMRFRRSVELTHSATSVDEVELRSLEHADNPFPDASPEDFSPVREVASV